MSKNSDRLIQFLCGRQQFHFSPALAHDLQTDGQATAIELWQQYLVQCQQAIAGQLVTTNLLKQLGHCTRNFAKTYPARYQVMMQIQLQPSDPTSAAVIQQCLTFLRQALQAYDVKSIDG